MRSPPKGTRFFTLLQVGPGPDGTSQQEDLITVLYKARWHLLSSLNSEGETPLHRAARAGHVHAVQENLENLAENQLMDIIATRNCAGENALHLAAMHGHAQVVTKPITHRPST